MRPSLHEFRIYGAKNGLILDQDQETLIKLRGDRFKSYVEKYLPPAILAAQYLGNLKTNMRNFIRSDFHMKAGMKYLVESFYRSIVENTSLPIPYREILLTARIMDAIFGQLDAQRLARRPILRVGRAANPVEATSVASRFRASASRSRAL